MLDTKTLSEVNRGPNTNFPLYIWWSEPQENTVEHSHQFIELTLIMRGHARHICGGTVREVEAQDCLVIPRGLVHTYHECSPDFSLVNIIFMPETLPMAPQDMSLLPGFSEVFYGKVSNSTESYPYIRIPAEKFDYIMGLAKRLREEDEIRTPGYRFSMTGLFMTIISELSRLISKGTKKNPQVFFHISSVISYLNKHFREKCTIEHLAHLASMSTASMQRHFFNATGVSPRQFQFQLQLAEAQNLLRNTNKSIEEIADESGFGNRNYFSRQFKKMTGHSPAEFRKQSNS